MFCLSEVAGADLGIRRGKGGGGVVVLGRNSSGGGLGSRSTGNFHILTSKKNKNPSEGKNPNPPPPPGSATGLVTLTSAVIQGSHITGPHALPAGSACEEEG